MDLTIPEKFQKTTLEVFGEQGKRWLEELPALLAEFEARWQIRVGPPFDLSYNYVAPAVRADGTEVVLKAGCPHPELLSEMTALRNFDGRGIVRLLESDLERGGMLIERLRPGVPLAELADDDEATRITAGVMHKLWIPAPENPQNTLCTAVRWAHGLQRLRRTFGGGSGPFPARLVEQAERLFDELFSSAGPPMLLHGDLHHWNILSAGRQPWLALDPKGLIGEAEYEVGALTRNRWPDNGPKATQKADIQRQVDRRLAIFAEMLGFDRQRMLRWCMAQAVLSTWWSYEDHHLVETEMILFSEALSEMIG